MARAGELRLGTRGSQLALWQARAVASRIEQAGGPRSQITVISTTGDRLQEAPLSEVGGKRLFVKEIEDALLNRRIDLAVHSSKDMPAVLPDGLTIAAALPREDPFDAVVLPSASSGASGTSANSGAATAVETVEDLVHLLGQAPSIGTSSVRRIAQLIRLLPNGRFAPIRGNLDTRLRKLDAGEYDALVLAAAGLRRLGFASRISFALPANACLPAPGQGIVAVEIRERDEETHRAVAPIADAAAGAALAAERALVVALGGGCQTPIGALASPAGDGTLELVALVVALDGSRALRAEARGPFTEAVAIGTRVGRQLMAEGASEILGDANSRQSAVGSRLSVPDQY